MERLWFIGHGVLISKIERVLETGCTIMNVFNITELRTEND